MNRFKIVKGKEKEFEDVWKNRDTHLQGVNGFKEFHLVKGNENEEHIIYQLEMAPEGYTIFGHFGYAGCLNSVGDADFSLSLRHFGNTTTHKLNKSLSKNIIKY